MKKISRIKKVAPSAMSLNTDGTLNLRSRARAAKITEALLAILAKRGPTVTADLRSRLGAGSRVSSNQIHRLLKKAKNVRAKGVFYLLAQNMYGLKGDRRWKSAEQAFLADRRKAHSDRMKRAWQLRKSREKVRKSAMQAFLADRRRARSDKRLATEKQERRPMDDAENIRSPATAHADA